MRLPLFPAFPRTGFTRYLRSWLILAVLIIAATAARADIRLEGGRVETTAQTEVSTAQLRREASSDGRSMAVIQFKGPIRREWITSCESFGIRFHYYLPDFAYVVTMRPDALTGAKTLSSISWTGVIPPELKVSPRLRSVKTGNIDIEILSLDSKPAASLAARGISPASSRMSAMGWQVTRATIPVADLDGFTRVWGVLHIEAQPKYELHGERAAQAAAGNYPPGGTTLTGPGYSAWLASHSLTGAPGVVVQVQDDGLDQGIATNAPGTAHPDILGRIHGIFNATSDLLGDTTAGHGEINAGIIMGNAAVGTTDAAGFKLGQGLAPQARVYATKIFNNSGGFDTGTLSFSDLAKDAQDHGVLYSSNSWGADAFGDYTSDSAEFDLLVRDADPAQPGNQSITYFFSAGNSGPFEGTLGSPATAKNVIAVGAGENTDADGTDGCSVGASEADSLRDLVSFSSRGPTTDGRLGVTVFATGTHVQGPASTAAGYNGSGVCDQYWPIGQTDYARSSGTSHSCPTAAGAGLIVHEFLVSHGLVAGNPSPALIRAILANTATDMSGGNDGMGETLLHVPDPMQGWGSVNLSNLVDVEGALKIYDQQALLTASGDSWEASIVPADPAKPLKITLAWSDRFALPGASPVIINDLDLVITGDAGTYHGNSFTNGLSDMNVTTDRLNTIESAFIPNPSGVYTVRVEAFNIAGDGVPNNANPLDQDFAIFVWNGTDQSRKGFIRINKPRANCSDSISVIVSDLDLQGAGSVAVEVSSSTTGDTETMTLIETPPGSGVLRASIGTTGGAPTADGQLQVADGNTITARYDDANDGTGNPAIAIGTALVDCSPPTISNLTITGTTWAGFNVEFDTNEPAEGAIAVGPSCGAPDFTLTGGIGTHHMIAVTALSSCTPYYVTVSATDRSGNAGIDDNSGSCYRVTTLELSTLFSDDFESASDPGWSHSAASGEDRWNLRAIPSAHSPTHVYSFEPGQGLIGDASLVTPWIQGGGLLTFYHSYAFEPNFDGGVLEVSVDGGQTWSDLGPYIQSGGYNGSISSFYGSAIAGRPAWTGGNFAPSSKVEVSLAQFPTPLKVRFRFGSDSSVPSGGWRIDDVEVDEVDVCLTAAGQVRTDKAIYAGGQLLGLSVYDLNAQGSSIQVQVTTQAGDSEFVSLTDPDNNKIYQGSLPIAPGGTGVSVQDGAVQGNLDDLLVATYQDADDGGGQQITATDSAILDSASPSISNVQATNIPGFSARVALTVSEAASVSVRYGLSCGALDRVAQSADGGTTHNVELKGLTPETTYYFRIEAIDAAGNTSVDDAGGSCHSFTTPPQIDYFTQRFQLGDNDLAFTTLLFTPDGAPNRYAACRTSAAAFPTDPAGGTQLRLRDDDSVQVPIGGGQSVRLYGQSYPSFYVGSNGYITLGSPDLAYFEDPAVHFFLPRVSALFDDLNPGSGGSISYRQLADRVAITYENVPQYLNSDSNNFQVELFFDGRIRLTYLQLGALDGLAGLSEGNGLPPDFIASDFAAAPECFRAAPVIRDFPDVIIGDVVEPAGATATNEFVYPDALDLRTYFVSDNNSTSVTVKWSFLDLGDDIQINGVDSLDPDLGGIGANDPTDPSNTKELQLNDNDSAAVDASAFTITFRNKAISPDGGPVNSFSGDTDPMGTVSTVASNLISLFASDGTTFTTKQLTVFTVNNTSDALSGAAECSFMLDDFTDGQAHGWTGTSFVFGAGGIFSSATTSISTTPGLSGLCVATGLVGNFSGGWTSPQDYVALVDNQVYRVRARLTTSQAAVDAIPLWRMTYINLDSTGPAAGFQNFGGNRYYIDHQGGSAGIGRNRNVFDAYIGPNSMSAPAWRSASGGAFDPAAADFTGFHIGYEVVDYAASILAQNDSGTICIENVRVDSIGVDQLMGAAVLVANPPVTSDNFTWNPFGGATHVGGTTDASFVGAAARVALFEPTSSSSTLAGFDGNQLNPGTVAAPAFPVSWDMDTLYAFEVDMRADGSEADPPGIIILGQDQPQFEQITDDYAWRAPTGGGIMDRAASPKLTTTTYRNFWYSHDVGAGAAMRGFVQVFNRGDLNQLSGGDAVLITGYRIYKIHPVPPFPECY